MKKEHFTYHSNDHVTEIHAIRWIPEGKVRAVLQISHGMVEFIDRYDEFAGYLAERGILVTGNDHLGHGKSVQSEEHYGYFAKEDGNKTLLKDIHRLRRITQQKYPEVPYFLLGHSMGSFLVRQYLCIYGEGLAGAVIMGTGYQPRIATQFGMVLTTAMAKVLGWNYRSFLVDAMAFGGYNRKFGKLSGKAWLSRNEENVNTYMKEKLCNFRFTLNGYYNLFYSIYTLSFENFLNGMPRDLPVLFVSGDDDPVGQFGKGVTKVYRQFLRMGMTKVKCRLYPQDRHEILNEVDREDVYGDIYYWMTEIFVSGE
ncbi:MAG: alpha/beta hydrolase [Marvinbryantia sp.]|uniref:alpha/beta hydrolase n=1 Tax=Marvinbryantia sp. TaxID=2496532 RepID=UPI0025E405A2|nr:alpha/beta fold hydrolase [uncultured Marvinbryantia sp.]